MRYASEHHVIEGSDEAGVYRMVRTSRMYESLEDLEREFAAIQQWLSRRRATRALLVDLRVARGRNDPAFETALAAGRRALFRRFTELACLVGTLPGKMQLERYAKEDGVALQVFLCEQQADRWLADRHPRARLVASLTLAAR